MFDSIFYLAIYVLNFSFSNVNGQCENKSNINGMKILKRKSSKQLQTFQKWNSLVKYLLPTTSTDDLVRGHHCQSAMIGGVQWVNNHTYISELKIMFNFGRIKLSCILTYYKLNLNSSVQKVWSHAWLQILKYRPLVIFVVMLFRRYNYP